MTRGHRTFNIFSTNMRSAANKRIFEHLKFTKLANIRTFKYLIICQNSRIVNLNFQKIVNMIVRCLVVPDGDKRSRRISVIMMSPTSLWPRIGFKMSPTSVSNIDEASPDSINWIIIWQFSLNQLINKIEFISNKELNWFISISLI